MSIWQLHYEWNIDFVSAMVDHHVRNVMKFNLLVQHISLHQWSPCAGLNVHFHVVNPRMSNLGVCHISQFLSPSELAPVGVRSWLGRVANLIHWCDLWDVTTEQPGYSVANFAWWGHFEDDGHWWTSKTWILGLEQSADWQRALNVDQVGC